MNYNSKNTFGALAKPWILRILDVLVTKLCSTVSYEICSIASYLPVFYYTTVVGKMMFPGVVDPTAYAFTW